MALPWLIGAAIVGAVGAIATAVKSGSSESSSSSGSSDSRNTAEERRRREIAAEKREREEKTKRQADARALFQHEGLDIGRNLADSMQDWVRTSAIGQESFKARLTACGYRLAPVAVSPDKQVEDLLRRSLDADEDLNATIQNLDFYAAVYAVRLEGGVALARTLANLEELAYEQEELIKLKHEIRKFEYEASLSMATHS
nr:hypothetical protein [uncultured Janthinobacterium sp.]